MLPRSSHASAAPRSGTRKAEKTRNTGIVEHDNEGNEEGSEEDNEEDRDEEDHHEEDHDAEDHDEDDDDEENDVDGYQHHEDDQHDHERNNILSLEPQLQSPPWPADSLLYKNLLAEPPAPLEDRERPTEPDSTVAGRPRNLHIPHIPPHIPTTISDDRSEDSDIKARFLLALRSRNQSSGGLSWPAAPPKPPSPLHPPRISRRGRFAGPESIYNPGSLGGTTGTGNDAPHYDQLQLMLFEQQNKRRLMMARQQWDNMMSQPDLSSNIYPRAVQPGGGGPEQFRNIPGGANTTAGLSLVGYPQDLAPQSASQVPELQNFNKPMREHQEGHVWTGVLPPPPINRNPFSMNIPERAASAGPGTRTPEMRVDGMHPANHMPSSGVLGPYYNTDAAPSNFFGSSMASANPTYIHSQPLDIPDESSSDLNKLLGHIEALQKRANALREQEPPQYKILYRLGRDNSSTVYLDAPQWALGQNSSGVLKSSLPLSNIKAYLERHPTVAFVVYRTYDFKKLTLPPPESEESGVFPPVGHTEESISIQSDDLVLAMTEFLKTAPEFTEVADSISQHAEVPAPYLFIYHSRSLIHQYLEVLPEQRRKRLSCLLGYIYSMYRDEYNEVDSLLQRKKIRLQCIKYLFRPGEVIVERKDQDIRGFCSRSKLSAPTVQRTSNKKNNLIGDDEQPLAKANGNVYHWEISGWSWKFDGTFSRFSSNLELSLEVHDKQEQSEVDINDLNLFPLAFADECLKQRLKKRGEMFWKCRFQHLVSYHDDDNHDLDRSADERFMIDLMTYRELHKQQSEGQKGYVPEDFKDDLGPNMMERKDPPDEKFIYLLPLSIKGFNLQRKRWVDLQVDRMDDVVWNKKAFKSLVLAHKTKDLIQALVSKQLDSEKSTDLIHGKGNGLILLLHGGSGTGKTFTAESVAEIAEKPLYRVTCGDIGTEPEGVEAYLESVLHLGKIWKGVILLDEADVFLEQRSLNDLRRNALVSIFLRVLEYYDGILVLTSNRVGTFDEAFKSRIQLALHYPKLDHVKRAKIWENFIERLEDLKEENIDFNDLRDNVEELAKNRMNGREIRNAITLARQYTQWKATKLNFAELQDIIKISGQFDVYLSELNCNITQDQLAQDDGLRLAEADK